MGTILSYSIELLGMHLASYEGRRYHLCIGHGIRMSWRVGLSFLLERPLEKSDPTVEIQLRSILQLYRSKGYQLGAYWRISTVGCILYRAMTLTVEFVPEPKYPQSLLYGIQCPILSERHFSYQYRMWKRSLPCICSPARLPIPHPLAVVHWYGREFKNSSSIRHTCDVALNSLIALYL